MRRKDFLQIVLGPIPLMLVPLAGMLLSDEWHWQWPTFVLLWTLQAGAIFMYKLATRNSSQLTYRVATGLALVTGFLLTWANLAVGIIGSEDNPANLMFGGVLAIGAAGALISRFQPQGMSNTLFAIGTAQMLVPGIALLIRPSDFSPGVFPVFALNAVFALLFAGAAQLYLQAAEASIRLSGVSDGER